MIVKPRILLDCDGVLGDFITPTLRVVELLTGNVHVHDDVVKWELEDLVPEQLQQTFWDALSAPGFTLSMLPYPGAVDAVNELRGFADVYVVTAYMYSSSTWVSDRDKWLRKHFDFTQSHVVHTKAKHVVAGDMLVDDKPSNVAEWARANPQGRGLLYDRNYNRGVDGVRVFGWGDILDEARQVRSQLDALGRGEREGKP